jgi:hypothetical protein
MADSPITRIYAAVIDGKDPANWPPYGPSRAKLADITRPLNQYNAAFPDRTMGYVRIQFLTKDADDLHDADAGSVVAVLIDGTDFSGDTSCPKFRDRADRLVELCFKLARQETAKCRLVGLRIWLVAFPHQKLQETRILWDLKGRVQPVLQRLGLSVPVAVQLVLDETVILHVAQDAANEIACAPVALTLKGGWNGK